MAIMGQGGAVATKNLAVDESEFLSYTVYLVELKAIEVWSDPH